MATSTVHSPRSDWRLLMALTLIYLSLASGRFVSTDEIAVAQVARSLAGFKFDAVPVSKYAIGMSLVEVPFLWLGTLLSNLAPAAAEQPLKYLCLSLMPALLGAGAVLLTWKAGRSLAQSPRAAAVSALTLGLASFGIVYATRFFSETAQSVALVGALVAVLGSSRHRGLYAALWLGGLLLLKPASAAVAFPFFAIYLWRQTKSLRALVVFGAGVLPGLVIILLSNKLRYGDWLAFGYSEERDQEYGFHGNLWTGVYGLTLSSGGGLLIFMPISVLGLGGLLRLRRRLPETGVLLFGVPIAFILFHAKWWSWHGGWCWGPRFLVPIVPFIALGVGEWFSTMRSTVERRTFAVLWILSALIQLPGLAVSSSDYATQVFESCRNRFTGWQPATPSTPSGPVDDQTNLHFLPAFSPPLGHAWMAATRVLGDAGPAPWSGERLCLATRPASAPLEWWWARAMAGGSGIGLLACVVAAGLMGLGVIILRRWWSLQNG